MKKKVLLCVIVLLTVFVLSGCGKNNSKDKTTSSTTAQEKKLQCSLVGDNKTEKFIILHDDEKIIKVTYINATTFKNTKTAKSKYSNYTKKVSELNKYRGVTASCSQSNEVITTTFVFTIANLDEKGNLEYTEIFGEYKDKNINEIKDAFVSENYTCK